MATCKSCDAPIRWAVTGANRKPIPLDVEPTVDGNVELVDGYTKTWGSSHAWPDGALRYRSHYASCPDADTWRRKKKSTAATTRGAA